ncbi:MAG TPA: hypothetical protein VKM55_10950 [Candidatus Lokiarchaeia archaeon]|nr:hypothetical protein [Candidatus Lokiarchaeia archaeon]
MPLDKISIEIIGAESLGVRSMCCLVKTPDDAFLLDPGCALGPRKGHEIPHPAEYKKLNQITESILAKAKDCKTLFISHFHHDHFKPRLIDETYIHSSPQIIKGLYTGKIIYLKSQKQHIGQNQRSRGKYFKQSVSKLVMGLHDADFQRFTFGETIVDFSYPVPHGEGGTKLGHIIMARFTHGNEHFVYAPDVQGPVVQETMKFILDTNVDAIFLGGPPFYLKTSLANFPFDVAEQFVVKLHERIPLVVIDHHCCRDREQYNDFIQTIHDRANLDGMASDHVITCAADFMGEQPAFLESSRAELFEQEPPSKDFKTWMELAAVERNKTPPPLET